MMAYEVGDEVSITGKCFNSRVHVEGTVERVTPRRGDVVVRISKSSRIDGYIPIPGELRFRTRGLLEYKCITEDGAKWSIIGDVG